MEIDDLWISKIRKLILSEFLYKNNSKKLAGSKICFKNSENPSCIEHFITCSTGSFQNTITVSSGLWVFHKMMLTLFKVLFLMYNL